MLTGTYHGKSIINELSQYIFNEDIVDSYIDTINRGEIITPPEIIIEAYLEDAYQAFGEMIIEKILKMCPEYRCQ